MAAGHPKGAVVVFDTETTGLFRPSIAADLRDPSTIAPEPVSLCWKEVGRAMCNYFVMKTETASDPKALAVHKITPEVMAEVGHDSDKVMRAFLECVKDASLLVGHNIRFDRKVIRAYLIKRGWAEELEMFESKPCACTMTGALIVFDMPPKSKWPKLQELCKMCGVEVDAEALHNARYDVQMTEQCFVKMREMLREKKKRFPIESPKM